MLYARWDIEELIEALVVAIVITVKRQETRDLAELDALLGSVLALLQVHEKWTEAYQNEGAAFSIAGYQAALENAEYTIRIRLGI
jgi:hypothetical protein